MTAAYFSFRKKSFGIIDVAAGDETRPQLTNNYRGYLYMAPDKIRKIPLHRKVKYLLNDTHWAGFMADHYFAKTAAANKSCDAAAFDRAVSHNGHYAR